MSVLLPTLSRCLARWGWIMANGMSEWKKKGWMWKAHGLLALLLLLEVWPFSRHLFSGPQFLCFIKEKLTLDFLYVISSSEILRTENLHWKPVLGPAGSRGCRNRIPHASWSLGGIYTWKLRPSHISALSKHHVMVTDLSSGFGRTGDSNSSPFTLNLHSFGHISDPFLTSVFLSGKWW